jgi:FemAB-related protein (PEP-CTERM system-associated)
MMRIDEWSGPAERWDSFVRNAPDGTVMHLQGWRAVLERAYGHPTFQLAAVDGDELCGVLPLALVSGPLLGRQLVSMPFMDYGGVCAAGNTKAEALLVQAAIELARARRATLALRYARPVDLGLPSSVEKVTMTLELGSSEDALWRRLPSERRNRIRRAQKHGLTAAVRDADALHDFYRVFAENMRELGSPVHSRRFFEEVLREFPWSKLVIVTADSEAIGAGLMLIHGGTISIPWVSSLRKHFDRYPNQLLYWEAMRFGIAQGHRILDFGRSSVGSGTYEAKRQWGATPVQLHWYYHPETSAPPGDDVKRLDWATTVWRRLPLRVANALGPWLRKQIPN